MHSELEHVSNHQCFIDLELMSVKKIIVLNIFYNVFSLCDTDDAALCW